MMDPKEMDVWLVLLIAVCTIAAVVVLHYVA